MPSKTSSKLFTSIDEVKQFIKWAKAEGIQQLAVGGVEVVFAPNLAGLSAIPGLEELTSSKALVDDVRDDNGNPVPEYDEELLHWSSGSLKA